MMCFLKLALMCSIIAASVVDLPEPVEPATSTMPRGASAICLICSSKPSCSKLAHVAFDVAHGQRPLAALLETGSCGTGPRPGRNRKNPPRAPPRAVFFRCIGVMVFDDTCSSIARVGNGTFDGDQFAVDAENDRRADFDVDVRRAAINGES